MRIPIQVTFRGVERSEALEETIRTKIEQIATIESKATGCEATVEPMDHRHAHGTLYRVTLVLSVPGDDLVVSREHPMDHSHEDPYVAARDALEALRRQVVERHRKRGALRRQGQGSPG